VAGAQPFGVVRIKAQGMCFHAHLGIERTHACCRQRGFFLATLAQCVPGLAMEVRRIEPVGVDDAQAADPGAGEVLQHRNAEASRAHHEH
jgi:hypothetical protein